MFRVLGICLVLSTGAFSSSDSAWNLNERGVQAAQSGKYAQAIPLYEEAIRQWRSEGEPSEKKLATALINLGQALGAQGMRSEASAALEEGLAISRRRMGSEHLYTLSAINYLAANDLAMGRHAKADALFSEAESTLRARYPGNEQLGRALGGLAAVRILTGNANSAQPYAEEALKIALANRGDESAEAALGYSVVALTHLAANRPARALPLYRKSIALYERTLGPDSPRVAATRSQMALVLMQDGYLSMAEDELRQALNTLSATCPRCEVELCNAETNLAAVRARLGDYKEADRLLSHVLSVQQTGKWDDGTIAATMASLTALRNRGNKQKEAALNRSAGSPRILSER